MSAHFLIKDQDSTEFTITGDSLTSGEIQVSKEEKKQPELMILVDYNDGCYGRVSLDPKRQFNYHGTEVVIMELLPKNDGHLDYLEEALDSIDNARKFQKS